MADDPERDEQPVDDGAEGAADGAAGRRVSRRAVLAGGAGAALLAGGAAAWVGLREPPVVERIEAARVDPPLPVDDPGSWTWRRATAGTVLLDPQQMVQPVLAEPTIDRVVVRALHDGESLAVRLDWDRPEPARHVTLGTACDAVAVMLPREPVDPDQAPSVAMGAPDQEVYIAYWSAAVQTDVDEGFQDVDDVHPGMFNDVHPEHPEIAAQGLHADDAVLYSPARAVENLMSDREPTSPIREMIAAGPASTTPLDDQRARGRGEHAGGGWRVAVEVPAGSAGPPLAPGTVLPVSFALWEGGHDGQAGARKHFAPWVELVLEEA